MFPYIEELLDKLSLFSLYKKVLLVSNLFIYLFSLFSFMDEIIACLECLFYSFVRV